MSDQSRSDRSRLPARNVRQGWVPRGAAAALAVNPPSAIPPSTIPRSTISSNPPGNGTHSHPNNAPPDNRHRMNNASRDHTGRSSNTRKDRGRIETQTGKVKDENLPQLVQEILEKLVKGTLECMICYDMVRRSAPIWSCKSCYAIFHLNCIKKWAGAPTSVDLLAEKNQGFNWRCPGCQSVQLISSKEIRYVCFCGKRPDPPSDFYLTPHSCGEPCGKQLEKEVGGEHSGDLCPHVCVLQCHPGPCPPCKAFAPPRVCPCGKKVITTRCSDRKSLITCGQRCDKLLDCQRHRCERVCHLGPCDPCQVPINASCFCKKKVEVVLCGEMAAKGELKAEDGAFSCNSTCGKTLSCGNHDCVETCHSGLCGECDLMPGRVKLCCCGKTSLQEERQSCLDPIPTCSQICGKALPCGMHHCEEVCHAGDCPPCRILVTQNCRCGSTSRNVECHITTKENEKFACERSCGQKKSCGRHRCSERCCPLSNSYNHHSGIWDPHFCQMACGKKLRCGQHFCESLCHSGHCPPCLDTIFTDLTCACGKTSIPPPLPCGTPTPSCQLPCSVPQPCGHPSSHSCHFGDCPPCSVPVAKECIGGHVVLRNIPCGSKDIRCNKLCGKTRRCGLHACSRTCHLPPCDSSCGPDPVSKASCGQACGAPRRDCRHTCTAPCHPSVSCPDVGCEFPVTISCGCGRLTVAVPCYAGGSSSSSSADTIYEASIVQKLPVPLQPVELNGKKVPLGQRKLMCDDECAKLERKKVLADAFDITPVNLDALHCGVNSVMSELLGDLYRRDPKWVLSVEERCKYLVMGKSRGTTSGLKAHVFCPMLKDKRDAVRLIAERWKVAIYSAGREPKSFIVVHATPKSKAPPRVIGVKGTTALNAFHLPVFDPLVDMDPRFVVSFIDLPREADINALVLRFGGECELVWLNDKNALAVFHDPARAATAMRRLDHASVYYGASAISHSVGALGGSSISNVWGGAGSTEERGALTALKGNSWKKAVLQDPGSREDSSVDEEWSSGSAVQGSAWKVNEAPIAASINRWSAIDSETSLKPAAPSVRIEDHAERVGNQSKSSFESIATSSSSAGQPKAAADVSDNDLTEVVDDWEKAYE
ncbi:NF-X1-type zinc finger protein NFXL1 [Tripterygium wilfordii]|uniref:NF-X1-type zinc finger protein NFXL1 n=2 Tax=Tripterygium wilfordii TaxID=458696 RepID=A0A7J7CJ01_TRIWF|nr:NF-X1-type zinc finger protein NFXL1 [Tripterygium wilfordii]